MLLMGLLGCPQPALVVVRDAPAEPTLDVEGMHGRGVFWKVILQPDAQLQSSEPFVFCFVRDGIAYAGQAPFTPVPDPLPLHATCGPGRFGRTWTVRLVPDFEGELEPSL